MTKSEMQAQIAEATARFIANGGEVQRLEAKEGPRRSWASISRAKAPKREFDHTRSAQARKARLDSVK